MVSKTYLLQRPESLRYLISYPRILSLKYCLGYLPQHQNLPARLVWIFSMSWPFDIYSTHKPPLALVFLYTEASLQIYRLDPACYFHLTTSCRTRNIQFHICLCDLDSPSWSSILPVVLVGKLCDLVQFCLLLFCILQF